ncbi:MAG: ribonuclease Y [Polyangiales bacterium]
MALLQFARAAAGAAASWILEQQKPDDGARRRELDALRARAQELEAAAAAARAQVDAAHARADASAALAEAARAEAEAARQAASLTLQDAEVRVRAALAAELDGLSAKGRARAQELEAEGRTRARQAEDDARKRAAEMVADAKQQAVEATAEARARHAELNAREEALTRRDEALARKEAALTQREAELTRRAEALTEREAKAGQREGEAERLVAERVAAVEAVKRSEAQALERVAQLSADDAKRQVIDAILEDARRGAAREAKQIEDLAREEAEKRAKRVVGIAVQRYAGEYAGERAATSVPLPNDELKGRLIGREGRNIRAFQEVTGCDLVIDDTPETITVSSFDPVRREMARLTLERLIQDGRIHPTRIEEFFGKAKDEVERTIRESGEQAALELNLGRLHPDLVKIVGQLRYRYSYAQNILRHSVEVGHMCGLLAQELGLNARQARRAGLLHDIGKAATHEQEGGHAVIGAHMARKAGEDEVVVNAIASHHDDEAPKSIIAHLTAAADAISGARPGARREMLEGYVKRLEDLEKICGSFRGVERSFAIQAGREVRVLVEPGAVDDLGALALSREIARKIESELAYPGQIRVTVVRETRAVDYAR